MKGKRMRHTIFPVKLRIAFTILVLILFTAMASGQEKVLYNFYDVGGSVLPVAGVISDAAGNLYGTTFYGGAYGNGMVFELSPEAGGWKQTVLHSFNWDGIDGFWVTGGLVFDTAGNLFGTTQFGGTGNCTSAIGGCGTVFELSPSASGEWTETILHNFQGSDGFEAHAGPIIDAAGNLYGTMASGGSFGQGTVYELSPAASGWTEKTLHHFTGGDDGGVPYGSLLLDAAGNLYGMASAGGGSTAACRYGCGTVFELSPGTNGQWTGKALHSFSKNLNDGHYPYACLILDASGNLYGSTLEGGGTGKNDRGIVFELRPRADGSGKWTAKILHNFNDQLDDGVNPSGTLIFDASGNLYGVTLVGGASGGGTVFKLTPTANGPWAETIVHQFGKGGVDGDNPNAGLIFGTSGDLFGTTGQGGTYNEGTVFEVKP